MKIGVVKEIKDKENRVALTPQGAKSLIEHGHEVVVERDAGRGSGFTNEEYKTTGAKVVTLEEAWASDLVVKIKEPLEPEYPFLTDNILFTYLHLSGVTKTLTKALLKARTTAIAYETAEDNQGALPLLAPMSAVAGNMAVVIGAYYLAKFNQGKGVQLGCVLGKRHGKVMIIGDGIVGQHATLAADGLGSNVYIYGRTDKKYKKMNLPSDSSTEFVLSNEDNIREHIRNTDLLIGAVLLPGAKAPRLVTEDMVMSMQPGSVIVDVSIDQGGCIETSRVTTHSDPVFTKYDVIHYCVSNMPGAYPRTSTIALTNATLPYVIQLADHGIQALADDQGFRQGLNTYQGHITYEPVSQSLDMNECYQAFVG